MKQREIDLIKLDEVLTPQELGTRIANFLVEHGLEEDANFEITAKKTETATTLTLCYEKTLFPSQCKFGYDDCVCDPAYLKHFYQQEKANCDGCKDGSWYDDEDK